MPTRVAPPPATPALALGVDYTEPDSNIPQEGRVGLQIHSGGPAEVWFKDITLEELPAAGGGEDRLKDKLVQRLRKLGYAVEVTAAEPAAWANITASRRRHFRGSKVV